VKLDQLMKREEFPTIFIETLTKYFNLSNGWEGEIVWGCHGSDEDLNLLVNSRLNLIYPVSMAKEDLLPLSAEYAYHSNPLRRFFHWLYINITLGASLRNYFSPIKIHLTNCSELPSNICILPGNHSIRIVNLDLKQCVVIAKKDYSSSKLNNAVTARIAYPDLPGPKLIDFNLLEGWYSEERIFGLPLDRTGNQAKVSNSFLAAKTFLLEMYEDTRISVKADTWMKSRYKDIDRAIGSLPSCYKESDIVSIRAVKSRLAILSRMMIDPAYLVSVAFTHGDLQGANLLVPSHDKSRDVYIIDWEYAGKRCSHYDLFVYGLRSRSSKEFASRTKLLLRCDGATRSKFSWYDFSKNNLSEVTTLFFLFLIDEFLFKLVDTTLPNLNNIPVSFLNFIKEVELIMDMNLNNVPN
jgi:hypothetical protein